MIYCHGHFKPSEIYKLSKNKYYLLDFAHAKIYPEGYELAFMIWADWMMASDWRLNYGKWYQGIFDWIADFEPIAKELEIEKFSSLIKVSLIERILGTILADVLASERNDEEKRRRLSHLYKLLETLL